MLLDDFFKILSSSKEDEKTKVLIELNKEHKIYEGHFPGNPVVPGVCLIQMIKETIETLQGKKLMMNAADEIKFLNIVNPLTANRLNIEIKNRINTGNPLAFAVIITDGTVTYLKMRAEYAKSSN